MTATSILTSHSRRSTEAAAAARPAGKKRAREGESSHSDALYSGQVYDVGAGCAGFGLDSSDDEADEMDEAVDGDDAFEKMRAILPVYVRRQLHVRHSRQRRRPTFAEH